MAAGPMNWRILQGDVRDRLADLPDRSVQTCVTSPPYWGLRDYGVFGQIGQEASPDEFLRVLVDVFRGVRRVLKDDGTIWVNLGDTYLAQQGAGFNGQKRLDHANRNVKVKRPDGVKPKDLMGIPWMVAFALRNDGWYLRSDIIWHKPNPMPESCTDRPTKAHEYIFLLSKSSRYYYDIDAIREPHARLWESNNGGSIATGRMVLAGGAMGDMSSHPKGYPLPNPNGANKRTVWTIATAPYPEAHFATFPPDLIEPCILAGSRVGDTVLDPFNGSGTTGEVAIRHSRNYIGIELNPAYIELARKRIGAVAPLLATEADDLEPLDPPSLVARDAS